jgi:hypothetical protein
MNSLESGTCLGFYTSGTAQLLIVLHRSEVHSCGSIDWWLARILGERVSGESSFARWSTSLNGID